MSLSPIDAARERGDSLALVDGDRKFTWSDIAEAIRELTRPARTPRRLAPIIDSRSAITIFAALADQAAIVLRHPKRVQVETLHPRMPRGAIAIESSGTSGEPKLVVHPRESLVAHAEASARALGSIEDDRWLVCLPLAHVSGLAPLIRAVVHRRAVILEPDFVPERIAESIAAHRATLISLVPTMLTDMLKIGWTPPDHVRKVLVGGARCPRSLVELARQRGVPVTVAYGMTETFSHVALDGKPLDNVDCRLDDRGVLEVRCPMSAAWPDWHSTGDLATIGEDGTISIIGRADDRIITGAENVDPVAVERAIIDTQMVADVVVVGVPDERWGQLVVAVVVADDRFNPDVLDAALKEKLADFERPRRYHNVDAIGRLASGKPDRRAALAIATRTA